MSRNQLLWLATVGILAAAIAGCSEETHQPVFGPPTACFAVTPDSGTVETIFELDASCAVSEEDPAGELQVRWDWEDDGAWDTDYSTTMTASHQFETVGTKRITLQVRAPLRRLAAVTHTVTVAGDSLPPEVFVLVQPNAFMMGSPTDEACRSGDEEHHGVALTRAFRVSITEVTQAQWRSVMGWNDSRFRGWNLPVERVTWLDAIAYCNRRSLREGLAPAYGIEALSHTGHHLTSGTVTWDQNADGYRLLTEAEWEYAARAGSSTAVCTGPLAACGCEFDPYLSHVGWYCGNSGSCTYDVATRVPNAWGLYDMHGNVREWCWDWYGSGYGPSATDPVGPSSGYARVTRGGGADAPASACRSASRGSGSPEAHDGFLGLRLARTEWWGDTPPYACFVVSPDSGGGGTLFEVDASCSADREDPVAALLVRWDWEDDGRWDTDYSLTKTAAHQYGAKATFTIRLEVRDTRGMTATTIQSVEVGSCPYLYSFDGRRFVLDAEAFSGAIMRARQATDCCRLERLAAVDGICRLKLANQLPETQFVENLEVIAIDHPRGAEVLPSAPGRFHTIRSAQAPSAAADYGERAVTDLVAARDNRYWISNPAGRDPHDPDALRDGLVLRFPRPAGADHAKLVCTVRNTSWLVEVERQLLSLCGWALDLWYAELRIFPGPRKEFDEFVRREAGLRVDLWNGTEWRAVDHLPFAGPAVARSVVVPLDLTQAEPGELRVRLESSPGLWMVDRVQVDFTPDLPVSVTPLAMRSAVDRAGRDVRADLAAVDGAYYRLEQGDEAELAFAAPPGPPEEERSYAMLCTGYYTSHVRSSAWPQIALLLRLEKEPGAFSAYAIEFINRRLEYAAARAAD